MLSFYTLLITIVGYVLRIIALFNIKVRYFVEGRTFVFETISQNIVPTDRVIWMHVASLGEFEQGLPILQKLRVEKPLHKIVVTFFSPSGYEIKKDSTAANLVTYLPLDTKKNARKFISLVHPELVVFIKYEFWPNYLSILKREHIPTYLVSGIFRDTQLFFKPYGRFARRWLTAFTYFFVQDTASKERLSAIGFYNVMVSGDTRFDRVLEILKRDNSVPDIAIFVQDKPCVVIGSCWPEDEGLLIPFINRYRGAAKFIIAPHRVSDEAIVPLKKEIHKKTVLLSESSPETLPDYEVLIVDTVGLLTKIYYYATIAYVGGGMGKKGLHNILEPAVFGIPVIIGKNFKKFNEANALVATGGVISVKNRKALEQTLNRLLHHKQDSEYAGIRNYNYIREKGGATKKIIHYIMQD